MPSIFYCRDVQLIERAKTDRLTVRLSEVEVKILVNYDYYQTDETKLFEVS